MQVPENILVKFPALLRNKLKNNDIVFCDNVQFDYEDIEAYRIIKRTTKDNTPVTIADFQSNAELGRTKIKGVDGDVTKIPEYYGVSFYKDKTQLQLRCSLPPKKCKIAKGYIYCAGGPILENTTTSHVCWWLYENVDVSNFTIETKQNESEKEVLI